MLHAKIHRARVTAKSLDYSGSITVDEDLLDLAGIAEFEKVLVVNVSNGSRAETYAIPGKRTSREVCLNGAAARLGEVGDDVIVMAFALVDDAELKKPWRPTIVRVDADNRPVKTP
jgi:aspartate 1-decarboxylase